MPGEPALAARSSPLSFFAACAIFAWSRTLWDKYVFPKALKGPALAAAVFFGVPLGFFFAGQTVSGSSVMALAAIPLPAPFPSGYHWPVLRRGARIPANLLKNNSRWGVILAGDHQKMSHLWVLPTPKDGYGPLTLSLPFRRHC